LAPFARSLAGSVLSLQEPRAVSQLDQQALNFVDLQPFERGRQSLLAVPMAVAPGIQVVVELFDKQTSERAGEIQFTATDLHLVAAAADFGADLLRHALAERQTHQVLFDALEAALGAGASVAETLRGSARERQQEPPPAAMLEQLRASLSANKEVTVDAAETLRLAEADRGLAGRHGPPAGQHCIRLGEKLAQLLDTLTRAGGERAVKTPPP